jgi:hypothetical protein
MYVHASVRTSVPPSSPDVALHLGAQEPLGAQKYVGVQGPLPWGPGRALWGPKNPLGPRKSWGPKCPLGAQEPMKAQVFWRLGTLQGLKTLGGPGTPIFWG